MHHDHPGHTDSGHHSAPEGSTEGKAHAHHHPIENVDEYIARLDRKDRDQWQKPDAVVAAMGLSGTETLADIGAGSGYFSFRFAKALPHGKVFAIDIEPKMVEHMQHRSAAEGVENIEVVLSSPEDPSVPSSSDWVFICNVLHHVEDPHAWLALLHSQLRAGVKVAIIEFKEGELPVGPPDSMKIAPQEVIEMLAGSGFSLTRRVDDLLPYQHLFVFARD